MADWSGRVVVEGKTYFLNGYIKKDGWIAGKLKPEGGGRISEKPRDEETNLFQEKLIILIQMIFLLKLRNNHFFL